MASVIEIFINQLLLKGDNSKIIIENIDNYFNYEHTPSEIDFALSLLLKNDNSLLQFINETCTQNFRNVFNKFDAAEKGLDLILKLVKGFIWKVEKYASNIKCLCVAIMQAFKISANCQIKVYCILIELFSVKQKLKKKKKRSFFTNDEVNEIVDKLFQALSNESKYSPSVLQKIYELWGVLGKNYETAVSPKAAQLLRNIVQKIKKQTESDGNVKLALLTGCVEGLNGLLVNFTGDLENDLADISRGQSNHMSTIYDCISKLCVYNPESVRKLAHRAALSLLTNHMSLFWDKMFLEYKWWHRILKEWMVKQGEDRKAGEAVLSRFQEEVTQHLSQSSNDENVEAFQYFVKYYKDAIECADTSSQELSLAIKGFGSLSGACSKLMNSKDVEIMFNLVLQRVLQMFKRVDSDKEKEYLPDFVEALSSIVRELEIVSEKQLFSLEQLCIFGISRYPFLLPNRQDKITRALKISIINIALNKENNKLDSFLSAIVYQGVIRTCSHLTLALQSVDIQRGDEALNDINYKSYITLWKSLINLADGENGYSNVSPEFMANVAAKIYDVMIETLLKLIDKLDISTRTKPQESLSTETAENSCEQDFTLEPTSIADNIILVNVAELYRELLLPSSPRVVGWISNLSYEIINKSVSFPSTASLYKLLAVVLNCADQHKYFESYAEDGEIESTSHYIVKFLEDLLVKLRQYTGDLQVSCLEVIMATPVIVLKPLLELIAPTFQAVFNVGRSYLELAHKGMGALERWQKELPSERLHTIVLDILPSFDPFLRSRVHSKDSDAKIHVPKSHKRHHKWLAEESELSKLQKRMLEFLSHLNTPTCLSLLDHGETAAVGWSSDKFLQVVIPFPDVRPEIYLDDILPRVVELALSSERVTRSVAGELLQAIVMVLLAKGKDVERSCSQSLKEVFEHIAPALLRLGSDPDSLTNKLFAPLMIQMTHWLSSKWMLKSVQTSVVLEAVWDGLTHPTDTAVRDFSAICLQEFVAWSIKQLTDSDLQHHPLNVKAAIKQINTYCLHPSPYKRFGAALAFNNLYRILREHERIIDIFWIELFYHFLRNLALSKTESTQHVLQALDHLERVLVARSGLFNKENNKRRIPVELKGSLLKDLLNWLIEQCASIHESYRKKCMQLVQNLACCIPGCGMVSEFLDGSRMASDDYCGGLGRHFLSPMPLEPTIASVTVWLKKLLSGLDCYAWLVEQGVKPNENLLSSSKSSFYEATKFLLIISLSSATPVMERLRGEMYQDHIALSVQEETDFKVDKCRAIVKLLKFVSVKELVKDIPEEFWSSRWWNVISNCVLTPTKLDFGINNQELNRKLPDIMRQLLTTLCNTLQESHLLNLFAALDNMEVVDCTTVCSRLNDIFSGEWSVTVDMKNHLKGLVVLYQSGVFSHLEMAKHWKGETILEAVAREIADSEFTIQPNLTALNYTKSLLSFAFLLQKDVTTTLNLVLDTFPLKDCKTFFKVTKGEHFTKIFKEELLVHLLSDPQMQCVDDLLNQVDLYKVDFIKLLVNYCEYSPSTSKRPGLELGRKISSRWHQLERWAGDDLTLQQKLLDIVTGVSKCFRYPNACFKTEEMKPLGRWVLSVIATPAAKLPLSFKRDVLTLLPCVAKQDTFVDVDLMDALKALKATHFPLTFSEFVEGSLEANTYQTTFQQLLMALVQSSNMDILEIIILETRTDANHPCKEDIDKSLSSFIKKLPLEHQTFALNKVFDMFCNERYSEGRLILLHVFMIPLLNYALRSPVSVFFSEIISWTQSKLKESLEKHDANKAKEQLKLMIGAFSLVGTMFVALDEKLFLSVNSAIVNASGLVVEKQFAKEFLSVAYNVRTSEAHFTDDEYRELFRLYQCSAYKTVISIITNCSWKEDMKEKYYRAFIFEEKPGHKLWSHIVPTSVPFSFPIDFDELPKRKKQLVEIKAKIVEKYPEERISSYQSVFGSQSLFTSTLNEDITKYDFTGYSVRTYEDSEKVRAEQESRQNVAVELDVDILNQHECMPLLCGFIRSVLPSSAVLPDSNQDLTMPPWMRHLIKPLEVSTEHKNVKVFILKLILNCEECFRPYAKFCFFPVIECLLSKCLGDSINYMTADVIEMLTVWYKVAKPDQNQESNLSLYEKMQMSNFVEFLIEKCPTERRNVFNYNLDLIKLVIAIWKPQIPYNSILQITTPRNGSKNQRDQQNIRIGLTIASILLSNDTLPFEETGKTWYFKALKSNLMDSNKYIYKPCADVIGRLLKKLDRASGNKLLNEDKSFCDDIYEIIRNNLSHEAREQYNLDRFVVCVHAIQEHYAPIALRFLANIKNELPLLPCTFRVMMLEGLKTALEAKSWESCPYLDLMRPVFTDFLTYDDEETKVTTLNILHKMLPMLTETDAEIMLQHVIMLSEHAKSPCRYVIYNIVASYYDRRLARGDRSSIIVNTCKEILIRGLVDNEPDLKEKMHKFWNEEGRLSNTTTDRFVDVMSELYSPKEEYHFLSSAVSLLLEPAVGNPYCAEAKVFSTPLSDCKYEDYNLMANSRTQHASLAPMFAQTLPSLNASLSTQNQHSFNIRATPTTFAFTATVRSQDDVDSSITIMDIPSTSSFLLSGSSQSSQRSAGSNSGSEVGVFDKPKRRRILRNKELVSRSMADRNIQKNVRTEKIMAERRQRRDAQVSIVRNYRIGDFPDVEIKYADLVKPLQLLLQRDLVLARQVLVSLYNALKAQSINIPNLPSAVSNILESSTQFEHSTMGSMLDVILTKPVEFPVKFDTITKVCKNSKLLSLGSLLIEQLLLGGSSTEPPLAKKSKPGSSLKRNDSLWIQLAEMYRCMGEMDVVKGIFEDKMASVCGSLVQEALLDESIGNWRGAQQKYTNAITKAGSSVMQDFLYEACFMCCEYMSDWKELNAIIRKQVNNDLNEIWYDSWTLDHYLPGLMSSEINIALTEGLDRTQFFETVHDWMSDPVKEDHLKSRLGESLCMIYLLRDDEKRCKLYSDNNLSQFIDNWAQLDVLQRKLRVQKLLQLQSMMEIHHFISLPTEHSKPNSKVKELLHHWTNNSPSNLDSLNNWETRALYRHFFCRKLQSNCEETANVVDNAQIQSQLSSLLDCAIQQENFYVARKYIILIHSQATGSEKKENFQLLFSKVKFLQARLQQQNVAIFEMTLDATNELRDVLNIVDTLSPSLKMKLWNHVAVLCCFLKSAVESEPSLLTNLRPEYEINCQNFIELEGSFSAEEVVSHLHKKVLCSLQKAVDVAEEMTTDGSSHTNLARTYFELAKYSFQGEDINESVVIEALLKAMEFGSCEARQLFPKLLQLRTLSTSNAQLFRDKSDRVPEWMLLQWLPQLLSSLDSTTGEVLGPLLERIARAYPGALQFPFQLSCEMYENSSNKPHQHVISRLKALLIQSPTMVALVDALTCLHFRPTSILSYHLKRLKQDIENNIDESFTYETLKKESFLSPQDINKVKGSLFQKNSKYEELIEQVMAALKSDKTRAISELNLIIKDVQREEEKEDAKTKNLLLKTYSPFLDSFNQDRHGDIEIPGQYTGHSRPIPEQHVMIAGFKSQIQIMDSLRRPIRITIIGNDAKERHYLVKFGEDLRQDQRIQQLFGVMNQILATDADTASRGLFVDTYTVVPLNTRSGLIAWVSDTMSLKDVIVKSEIDKYKEARKEYSQFISGSNSGNFVQLYSMAFKAYSKLETVQNYKRIRNILPSDLLRKAVHKMASSSEAYVYLRSQMLTSHAVLCICHWLLGIGDRHLDNTLMSTKTGRFIGIDFGHAFDTAVGLPVPELMPFRMTPQIVNLAAPLYLKGTLQETMVHTLHSLRTNHQVMLNTMYVFIQEPSINWLTGTNKYKPEQGVEEAVEDHWYPREKIKLAGRKLKGDHPSYIMVAELEMSQRRHPCLQQLVQLVKGDEDSNLRTSMDQQGLTARQQVQCLLDQATDKHILGKTYIGWDPFV